MTNQMTNPSSSVYNFVSEVTNLTNLDSGATNLAFALTNYSHRARIPDHIPQPGGPRALAHEVKIHAWIYGPETLSKKIEVKISVFEVKIRASEVKSCAYEVKIRAYEVKISAYEVNFLGHK